MMPGKCRDGMLFIKLPDKYRFKAKIFDHSFDDGDGVPEYVIRDVEMIDYKTGHIFHSNGYSSCNYELIPHETIDPVTVKSVAVKVKKYIHCAKCGAELGGRFFLYCDNFLQVKYFDEQDGSDNAFCSMYCAAASLMLEETENEVDEV